MRTGCRLGLFKGKHWSPFRCMVKWEILGLLFQEVAPKCVSKRACCMQHPGNPTAMVSCSRGIRDNQSMFELLLQEQSILVKGREGLNCLKQTRFLPNKISKISRLFRCLNLKLELFSVRFHRPL